MVGIPFGFYLKAPESKSLAAAQETSPAPPPPSVSAFASIHNKLPDEYNILLPVTRPLGKFSVVLNLQDKGNFYLVEFGQDVRIAKVENGLVLPLAAAAMPANLPPAYDIVIKRRSRELTIGMSGTIAVQAFDASFAKGQAMVSRLDCLKSDEIKVQRVGEIYFADDFMKGVEKESPWTVIAGSWQVNTLQNSSLSSNAFFYTSRADAAAALSIAGYWFWDNYAFEASCKGEGAEDIGLCFYFRDAENYYLFRWNADGADGAKGRRQLVRVAAGQQQVIAEQPGGYSVNQWYKMQVSVNRQLLRAFIDDSLVFTVYEPGLVCGRIGLYNRSKMAARFDDVFVRRDKSVYESFVSGSAVAWQQIGGTWKAMPATPNQPNAPHGLQGDVPANGAGKAITGEDTWRDYAVTATVSEWKQGSVGLAIRYLDESNHYQWSLRADDTHQLVRVVNGVQSVLAEVKAPVPKDRPFTMFLAANGRVLTAGVAGNRLVEVWDESLDTGRAGLCAWQTGPVAFGDVSIVMTAQHKPVLTTNIVFQHEKTMQNWASNLSDWQPKSEVIANRTYSVAFHRADFPGDVEISAKLPKMLPEGGSVRLVVAAEEKSLDAGYALSVATGNGLVLELFRKGQPVARGFKATGEAGRVSLQRKGSFIIGSVNYEPIARFKDDAPLAGVVAGIGEVGMQVSKDDVEVTCPNVKLYTFDEAGFDWRVASGTWQVTNRWQCDPRWSFFSGKSSADAIIWCKRIFRNDFTVEFAAGIQMDAARGGRYEYASDINATICADGKDITSGYSFMFGAQQNTATRIMRGDNVLAESKTCVIPNQQDIHRRWFYFKIRKHGAHLQYFRDNELILETDDPQPLTGGHLAIWTHNNGIMLAKVRLSCLDQDQKESPDFKPTEQPKSPYTK